MVYLCYYYSTDLPVRFSQACAVVQAGLVRPVATNVVVQVTSHVIQRLASAVRIAARAGSVLSVNTVGHNNWTIWYT